MSEIIAHVFTISSILLIGCLFFLFLAPLETIGWWTRFSQRRHKQVIRLPKETKEATSAPHYIIFLDGIAKAEWRNYDDVELFLTKLRQAIPEAAVIGSVLPYSVTNRPLTRFRPLAGLWKWLKERKVNDETDIFAFSINLRNLLQVMVSADSRYGPIYNLGVARLMIEALLKQGYPVGYGIPITLIGYSGGGQVAAGAAPYLKELLRAPVDLISLGGVISADPGLNDVRFLYHLAGSKDSVEATGTLAFPGRWPIFRQSSWNKAKRKGKFTYVPMGPIGHNGAGGYLDEKATLENGKSFLAHTVDTVSFIVLQPETVRLNRVKRGPLNHLFELSSLKT